MITRSKPFHLLTARELMSRDLLLIPREASLRHAAHMLAQSQVSGAPVVDDAGRCVGVISTTDFVRWMDNEPRATPMPPIEEPCHCSDWEAVSPVAPESLPMDSVCSYMTPDPVTVMPEARVGELARMMLDAHIHRVIVVDTERRPIGVVTTTDVLAAVAGSPEPAVANG
jgi:CBS domain-containing protein